LRVSGGHGAPLYGLMLDIVAIRRSIAFRQSRSLFSSRRMRYVIYASLRTAGLGYSFKVARCSSVAVGGTAHRTAPSSLSCSLSWTPYVFGLRQPAAHRRPAHHRSCLFPPGAARGNNEWDRSVSESGFMGSVPFDPYPACGGEVEQHMEDSSWRRIHHCACRNNSSFDEVDCFFVLSIHPDRLLAGLSAPTSHTKHS
jgi:hypothetical protein